MGTISRRAFLRAVGLAGLTGGVTAGLAGLAGCAGRRYGHVPRPRYRVLTDLHAHAMIDEWNRTTPFAQRYPLLVGGAVPLANRTRVEWEACHRAGVDVVCVAHYNIFDEVMSMPVDPDPGAVRHTAMMMDQLEEHLEGPAAAYARIAQTSRDLSALLAVDKGSEAFRTAVVHTLEGSHALGGDLSALEAFAARGVAAITISHFFDKGVGSTGNALPFFPDAGSALPRVGLHPFGRELIAEMERLGVVVDVTHLAPRALDDALAASQRPLMVSHASSRALGDHPYALGDGHAREIARRGGVIGVILYPLLLSNYSGPSEAERWGSLRDVVRTVRHFVKVCGSHEHIALGSDFGAYITPPREIDRLSRIGVLRDMLLDEFADERVVDDIMANNAIDFLLKNWGHHA